MPCKKKSALKGGSAASDAVMNAVPAPAFDKLNAMFDNTFSPKTGGASSKRRLCKVCGKLSLQNHQCSSKRGGTAGVVYNHDGMLASKPQEAGLPVRAVDLTGGKSRSLRHISHFSDSSSYKLRNRLIGGADELPSYPIGLTYNVTSYASPAGPTPVPLSPNQVLGEMKVDSVAAPMVKTAALGNITGDLATPFKYGGGVTKKIVMAVAAKHLIKRAVNAVKKMKENKAAPAAEKPKPKPKPKTKSKSKPKSKSSPKKK